MEISNLKILSGWDAAIYDTMEEIKAVKWRLRELEQALVTFRKNKAQNEPWPGTIAKSTGFTVDKVING